MTTTPPPGDTPENTPIDDAIPDETVHFDVSLARLGVPVNDAIADETVPFDIRLARLEGGTQVRIAEADAQEDLERTTVSTRRRPAASEVPAAPENDDDPERTTLVERRRPAASETPADPDGADDFERTEVVDRGSDSEDTIVVGRAAAAVDGDDTVVTRPEGAPQPPRPSVAAPVLRTRGDRRRGISPPPVPAGFAPAPKAAVGPGAVESYPTRALDAAREITAPPLGGIEPTRDTARPLRSAARDARIYGRVAVAGFAVACVMTVVGLIVITTQAF